MSIFFVFVSLMIIVSLLLILVIMVQNPKGGGLSSAFGGGGTQIVGGVKKTGDFLDKSTWVLAIILVALILLSNTAITRKSSDSQLLENKTQKTAVPAPKDNNQKTLPQPGKNPSNP